MIPDDVRFANFVGRDEELAWLLSRFNSARDGEGSAVLVVAPQGCGKSRLVREFRKLLGSRAERFAFAGNLHRDQTPFAPFREALGNGFLESLFEPGSVRVLAIDDLQWADDASLELIGRLCRHADQMRLLLLATLRTSFFSGDEPSAALTNLLPSFKRIIHLGPLSVADVRGLMKDIARAYPELAPNILRRIERSSGGNPLFLEELSGASAHALARGASPELTIPPTFESAVLHATASLPVQVQRALPDAAVLGTSFDVRVLSDVAKLSNAWLAEALQKAYEKHIIVPLEGDARRYEFAHPLIRDVLYTRLTPAVRALKHGLAATALERDHASRANPGELSDHWFSSNEPNRSLDYAERAAIKAETDGNYAEAAHFYERILTFRAEPSRQRAEICQKLGRALYFGGLVAQSRPYLQESAAFYSADAPDVAADLLCFLAMALWHDGNGPAALAVVHDALQQLADCGNSLVTCHLLTTAASLCHLLGMRDRSLELLERAEGVRCRKSTPLKARIHHIRACCLAQQRRFPEAIVEFEIALNVLKKIRDPGLFVPIAQNASACLRSSGRFKEAEQRARSTLEYARKHQAGPLLETTLALLHATLLSLCGRLQEAARLVEQSVASNPDFRMCQMELLAFGLPVALAVDRPDLVDACFDESSMESAFSTKISAGIGTVAYAVSKLYYARGDVKGARALLRRGLRSVETAEFVEPLILAIAEYGASADFKRARALLAGLPESAATPAFLALFDAFIAQRGSKVRERRRFARDAAAQFEKLGAPLLRARALELAGQQKQALAIYHQAGAVRDAKRLENVFVGRGRKGSGVLTDRQIEIGYFVAAGQCNRTIARDLQISAKTLESHLTAIYRRLGVASRSDIVAYMLDQDRG
jgi:DNA-binding CsgD family transcriptional regulator